MEQPRCDGSKQPTVSIVIPVYNARWVLWDCTSSILEQTMTDWEVIYVDDGSTDPSPEFCDVMVRKNKRFRVIHQENGGVSRARNAGLDAARGKYVVFVDADDAIMPTYLEQMVHTMETYGTELVISGYERFRGDWKQQYVFTEFSLVLMKELEQFLMTYTQPRTNMFGISIWAKMYRMDLINQYHIRFDPEITYEEDCDFNVRYLAHTKTVAALGEVLYRYRQSDTSLSKAYRRDTYKFLVHGFRKRCELLEQHGLGEYRPDLEAILLLVVKATSVKLINSDLTKREKLEEFRSIVAFPETQAAGRYRNRPKSFATRRIAFAIRHKNARLLYWTMVIWRIGDRMAKRKEERAQKRKDKRQGKQ